MRRHDNSVILISDKIKIARIVFLQQMLGLILTNRMIDYTRRTATDVRLNMKFDTAAVLTAENMSKINGNTLNGRRRWRR